MTTTVDRRLVVALGAVAPDLVTAELVPLDGLRSRSRVVTLHLPLTSQTRHLVDADFLAAMPGATRATFTAAARGVADVLDGRRPAALADPEWTFPDRTAPTQENQ